MRLRHKGRGRTRSNPLDELGSRIERGLKLVDDAYDIDEADYGKIKPSEVQKRIADRINEQNTIILPKRKSEGKLTPEWKLYEEKSRA